MSKFVFITDIHLNATCGVRNGNPLEDIIDKLNYVVDYANKNSASILIGGDVFDHPCVPDFVKSKAAGAFRKAKKKIYTIAGNHDILYNNTGFNYRTSYNLFKEVGLFTDISDGIDLGDVRLDSCLPLEYLGKPQICMFHGFYNVKDGNFTCNTSDVITTTDETLVLLGHDHSVYPMEQPRSNVRVIRPGSLFRGMRTDEQNRTPQMVVIDVKDGKFDVRYEDIKCRAASEIFTAKNVGPAKKEKDGETLDYESIISRIRVAKSTELTLESALREVTSEDVIDYVNMLISE